MGNSISLSCCPDESMKPRGVLVIKEDGESLKFKDGTLVKDILSGYPFHKIVRCCSERMIIPSTVQLSCNWLYMLLPKGLALTDTAYQNLMKSAASKELIATAARVTGTRASDRSMECRQDVKEGDYGYKWKPVLKTIPELPTSSV